MDYHIFLFSIYKKTDINKLSMLIFLSFTLLSLCHNKYFGVIFFLHVLTKLIKGSTKYMV